jgi:hypothetical protein
MLIMLKKYRNNKKTKNYLLQMYGIIIKSLIFVSAKVIKNA